MNSAIRDSILLKDFTLLKAVGVAVLVQLLGFTILALLNTITLNPKPLFWGAQLVGGFIFGIGMVLAGGCASGITYRVGEGMVGAISAVIGLSIGGSLTAMGFLKPIMSFLQTNTIVTIGEAAPTLANILGLNHALVAIIVFIVVVVVWWLLARNNQDEEEASSDPLADRIFKHGWKWLPTGIVVGIIGILAYISSTAAGSSYPLRITSGWITFVKLILPMEAAINWDAYLILGIIIGALIASLIAGEFKFRMPGWGMLGQTFAGGLLMGFGAVTSAGCNVTHILSGLPQLSIGSALATVAIALGAWVTSYLIFIRPNQ